MIKKTSEPEVKESYLKKLLKIEKEHFGNHGFKTQTIEELRKEIECN